MRAWRGHLVYTMVYDVLRLTRYHYSIIIINTLFDVHTMFESKIKLHENSKLKRGLLSRITFSYITPLVKLGAKRPLVEEDLWKPAKNLQAEVVSKRLETAWMEETRKKNPSFGLALLKANKIWILHNLMIACALCFLRMSSPIVLGYFIDWFAGYQDPPVFVNKDNDGYIWAAFYSIVVLALAIIMSALDNYQQSQGQILRIQTCSILYKKILKLNKKTDSETSTGEVINIMSNHVARYEHVIDMMSNGSMTPVALAIAVWQIYKRVGNAAFATFGCNLVLIIIFIFLGYAAVGIREKTAKKTNERLKALGEVIGSISVIKMYCWESFLLKKVIKRRSEEARLVKIRANIIGILFTFSHVGRHMSCISTLLVSFYTEDIKKFRASDVFLIFSFSIFVTMYLRYFYRGLFLFAECQDGHTRIKKFLLLPEHGVEVFGVENSEFRETDLKQTDIHFINYGAAYDGMKSTFIENLNFELGAGMILGVIGPVGSGKSTLVNIFLNELITRSGQKFHSNSISVATQETWIFGGTVKENIILGRPYEEKRYYQALYSASLLADIQVLPSGDQTLLGPKGVTLSGGQRARIGLARSVYKKADLYIMDDPFAAVDVNVASDIYKNCIQGFLKGKTQIIITHQFKFLKNAHRIIFLDNRKQVFFGSYKELLELENNFIEILQNTKPQNTPEGPNEIKNETFGMAEFEKNVEKEKRITGNVRFADILLFFRSCGSDVLLIIFVIMQLTTTAILVATNTRLSSFAEVAESKRRYCMEQNNTANWTLCDATQVRHDDVAQSFMSYALFLLAGTILSFGAGVIFFTICINASRNVHDNALASILTTKMSFFNSNPSGQIVNRFSQDVGRLDDFFPLVLDDCVRIGLKTLGYLFIAVWGNWFCIVLVIPIIILLFILRYYYLQTSRQLKRLESVFRTPIYSHVSDSMAGRTCIKSFEMADKLTERFNELVDNHTGAYILYVATTHWLAFRIDIAIASFITVNSFGLVALSKNEKISKMLGLSPSSVGLVLSTSSALLFVLQHWVLQSSEVENHLTSAERMLEYAKLLPESESKNSKPKNKFGKKMARDRLCDIMSAGDLSNDNNAETHPAEGEIKFENFNFNYYDGGPLVLKDISIKINAGEKIGVVGRTGSGKSSLIAALFRMNNEFSGTITINGSPASLTPLNKLRQSLAIIHQSPVIFSDTVRMNLDPYGSFTEEKIWDALRQVELKDCISEKAEKLEYVLFNQGQQLSAGEKQLFCLARALLNRRKILLIDEATANVDMRTDDVIQKTIRREFGDCTILTVAHRLETIADSDRIIIMDSGNIVAIDTPDNFLRDETSVFSLMLKKSNAECKPVSAN